jgi:tetratricopeptide (TPR) repeat protein
VKAGEPLDLTASVDENQTVRLRLARRNGEADDFRRTLQSPLSHTDASHKVRMRVLEREERIRRGAVDDADRGVEFRRLAEDYGELRQWEKAIDAMRTAIAAGEDGATSLNQIGVWYGRLHDRDREEQCYRRILEVEPFTHAMFNLALARRERGDLAEARAMIERACRIDPDEPCYRILKADLARRGGDVDTSRKLIDDLAREAYKPEHLSDWQLGWFEVAANLAADSAWQVQLKLERERRKGKPQEARVGVLPAAGPAGSVALRDAG